MLSWPKIILHLYLITDGISIKAVNLRLEADKQADDEEKTKGASK